MIVRKIRIADLDQRITLRAPKNEQIASAEAQRPTGEDETPWIDVVTVWAAADITGSTERFESERPIFQRTVEFVMRKNPFNTETMRAFWLEVEWSLRAPIPLFGENKAFQIVTGVEVK